jgi:hypothetical protein
MPSISELPLNSSVALCPTSVCRRVSLDNVAENSCSAAPVVPKVLINARATGASRWAMLASPGAHTTTHVDTNSIHMYARIRSGGGKLWLTAMPKPGAPRIRHMPAIDNLRVEVLKDMHLACTYLGPGDAMYVLGSSQFLDMLPIFFSQHNATGVLAHGCNLGSCGWGWRGNDHDG